MKRVFLFFLVVFLACGAAYGEVLLDDTWADGTRTDTSLPNESAVWAGHPAEVTVAVGSLQYGTPGYTSSHKLWTYFTADGGERSLSVGEQLVATVEYIPRGLYVDNGEDFRMGLYHDPTDSQVWQDINSDGGGSSNPWMDAEGYGMRVTQSSGAGDNPQIGTRTDMANTSLLGSSGAYTWTSGGADVQDMTNGLVYTAVFMVDYISASQVDVTYSLYDVNGLMTTLTHTDNTEIYTDFDHLFFRFSAAAGTADIIDFQRLKVEVVPEPATLILLGLGGLLCRRRR
jgi:hypothetical protein